MKLGFVTNTLSGRNRRALPEIRRLLAAAPGVLHREVGTPEEVAAALEAFAAEGVGLIALNGGDGTVQAGLTCLFGRSLLEPMPLLAVLPGGTTNMTAYDLSGGRRRLLPCIRALLGRQDWSVVERTVLRVRSPADSQARCGLFFGVGAIIRGMEYFQEKVCSKGLKNELGPGVTLARSLLGMLRGDGDFAAGSPLRLGLDGAAAPGQVDSLFLLVTTLERLFLGIRPYWGLESGPLRLTLVRSGPERLLRAFPALVRGRPNRFLTEAAGYSSHNANEVQLAFDGRFSLDGELYRARSDLGPLILDSAGRARFVRF